MAIFDTRLGQGTQKQIEVRDERGFTKEFKSATLYEEGTAVKLSAENTVTAVTAVTDTKIGYVVASKEKNGQNYVTVAFVNAWGIIWCNSDAAITVNTEVAVSSFDATLNLNNIATAVSTNKVAGLALKAATGADEIIPILAFNYNYTKA